MKAYLLLSESTADKVAVRLERAGWSVVNIKEPSELKSPSTVDADCILSAPFCDGVCLLPFLQACTQKWPHIPVVLLLQPSTKRAINECLDNHSSFEIIDLGSEISKVGSILRGIVLKKNKLRVLPVLKRCKQTRSPLFQQALEHIVQGFQRIRSPSEVYDAINPPMAKEVFRRRFEQEVGISPKKLILELRLQYAAHLISTTSLAIKQIAGIVGFDDCYQFSKAFRFHTGDSPTGYRKGSSLNSRQAKG